MTSTGFHATEMWRDMIGILHEQVSLILRNSRTGSGTVLKIRTNGTYRTIQDQRSGHLWSPKFGPGEVDDRPNFLSVHPG